MPKDSPRPSDFRDLPAWLWLWLPLAILLVSYVGAAIGPDFYRRWVSTEFGFIENLTLLFLFVAIGFGVRAWLAARGWRDWRLMVWIALFILGCIYYAGEEASWGQHMLGWDTPETWSEIQDQDETNLHNLSGAPGSLLDQLPRNLLTLAVFIGGVVAPLWRRYRQRPLNPERLAYWLWPTLVCLPAAVLAVFISVPEKIYEAIYNAPVPVLDISAGETKECYLALFLMLYVLSLNRRLRQMLRWRSGQSLAAAGLEEPA